jgi:transcriptional regulator with XRE-family HTH domain
MGTQSKLARARTERNLTQAEVAEYAEVDIATVCRWEKGTHQPYPRHVIKLCTLFEKPAHTLGLAPFEEQEISSPPVAVTRSKEENVFAKYFQRDIELRLHHIMYDWLHRERSSGSSCAMLQYRLSQEL